MRMDIEEYKYKVNVDDVAQQSIPKTVGSTKGSIIVFLDGSDPVELPLGANGQVLMVDRNTTLGVKWAYIS